MQIQRKSSYSLASRQVIPTKSERPTESIRKGSRNILKFRKPDENIQNLNDDQYAYQDLGCTPIDLHVDNPDNVGKCEDFFPVCASIHTPHIHMLNAIIYFTRFSVFNLF